MSHPVSLIVDIGGTNTRVAQAWDGALRRETIQRYLNKDHPGLDPILQDYIALKGLTDIEGIVVDVAGPVGGGAASLTNLDWSFSEAGLARLTGARYVGLINDLQAQGYAMGHVSAEFMTPLVTGSIAAEPLGTKLVVNVGTGFGAVAVYQVNGQSFVPPSENGHKTLPLRTAKDLDLARFLEADHGFAAVEEVASGRGLEAVYAWHCAQSDSPAEKTAAQIIAGVDDDKNASEAVETMVEMLGRITGDLALAHLPFGGIYMVGGVVRGLAPWLASGAFSRALQDKGRFGDYVAQFHVTLVDDDYAALLGGHAYLQNLRRFEKLPLSP